MPVRYFDEIADILKLFMKKSMKITDRPPGLRILRLSPLFRDTPAPISSFALPADCVIFTSYLPPVAQQSKGSNFCQPFILKGGDHVGTSEKYEN